MTLVQTLRRLGVYAAAALLVTAVSIKPVTVYAMGTDSPPPADDSKKKKKKKDNNVIEQQQEQLAQEKFLRDYRAARAMTAIIRAALRPCTRSDMTSMRTSPTTSVTPTASSVDYDDFKIWYERLWPRTPITSAHGPTTACGRWSRAIGSRRGQSAEGAADLRQHRLRGISPAERRDRRQSDLLTGQRLASRFHARPCAGHDAIGTSRS